MILIPQHPGSGVGDQLFCYLAGRITAERLGVPFTLVGMPKYDSFIKIDYGLQQVIPHHVEMPAGKIVIENAWPVYEGKSHFDPEFFFIEDDTIVDGCRLQDEKYWEGYPIHEWLKTEPIEIDDNLCIVGFRGGEYAAVPDLFLTKDYWVEAMKRMREINPAITFRIVTDDPDMARACFPHIEVTHDLSNDWRQVRHAKYSIIANSAFYVIPRWLRHKEGGAVTVCPRYWARRNIREWSTPMNYYKGMMYI